MLFVRVELGVSHGRLAAMFKLNWWWSLSLLSYFHFGDFDYEVRDYLDYLSDQ